MSDVFSSFKQRAAQGAAGHDHSGVLPFEEDGWIVSSVLQKSIRRGDVETAQRAALTLFLQRGSAIWRRLMVIAFEDVGVGSDAALASCVAVASNPNWRKANGGNEHAAIEVAGMLAEAPKDRSADYLICAAK